MSEPDRKASVPFVDRKPELAQLHHALQAVIASKKPKFMLIQGDYGVGKTELVKHFLGEAASRNAQLLIGEGKCAMESELSGLVPFTQLFDSLSDQGGKKFANRDTWVKFAKEVAPAWLDIVTGGIAGAAVKTVEEGGKLFKGNTFSQENVFIQFTNALGHLTEKRPMIVFIEDLHWADASSLGLVFHLARNFQERAVLFILTYRPVAAMETSMNAPLFREIRANLLRYDATELELRQGIDVSRYVAERYPFNTFSAALIERVQEQTDGHALYVSQVFSLWEENGTIAAIPTANGSATWIAMDSTVEIVIPKNLSEVLAERLHSMTEELRDILACAAVEGDDFTVQTIARLRQLSELNVSDRLEQLEHGYFLISENGAQQIGSNIFDLYRFAHRFFREHIYNQLTSTKKRVLHKQVGECLEALYNDRREIAGSLARHFREAWDWAKSAQYALTAAQFEQSRYAWEEGEKWCAFGLELVEKLPQNSETIQLQMSLLEQSGYGYYVHGNCSLADERYRKALVLAQQLRNIVKMAELYDKLAYVCVDQGQSDEAIRLLDQARQILADAAVPLGEIQIDIESEWAYIQAWLGNYDLALATLDKAIQDAQTLPQTPTLDAIRREIYSGLGVTLSCLNRYDKAIDAFQKCIQIDERLGRENKLVTDLINLANVHLSISEWDQGLVYAVRGEQMAQRMGGLELTSFAKAVKGDILLTQCKPQEALRELMEAIAIAERIGALWYIAHMYACLALAYRALMNLDTAYQKAICGLEYAYKTKYQFEVGFALDALAQVEASKQDWRSAAAHFAQAIVVWQESGSRHDAARAQCHLAEMCIAQGNHLEALKLLKEAEGVFQELGLAYEVANVQKLLTAAMS